MNRKPFQNLPGEENPQFLENGLAIYKLMRKMYPANTNEDLDNILNGLCAAITILMENNVARDNRPYIIQLVHKILTQNMHRNKENSAVDK